MRVKLTKVSELGDALHPNNIETGFEKIVDVDERYSWHTLVTIVPKNFKQI